jgi:pimeloyl-ACP methyl ester carboxylesterase
MQGGNSGIDDVVKRVKEKARECPNMKFALVGYSQGGMVVSSAIGKIPTDLHPKVVAMVLYGSGKGDVAKSANIKQKTLANCAPYDMVSFHGYLKRVYFLAFNTFAVRYPIRCRRSFYIRQYRHRVACQIREIYRFCLPWSATGIQALSRSEVEHVTPSRLSRTTA